VSQESTALLKIQPTHMGGARLRHHSCTRMVLVCSPAEPWIEKSLAGSKKGQVTHVKGQVENIGGQVYNIPYG